MLIIDNIVLAPFKGMLWLGKKIHENVIQEMKSSTEEITQELSELYMMLETGRITEVEFDAREKELLDELDRLEGHAADQTDK